MKKTKIIILLSSLFLASLAVADERPNLFFTDSDIARINSNIKNDEFFRELASNLINKAESVDIAKLPYKDFELWNKPDIPDRNGPNLRFMLMKFSNSARVLAYAWMLDGDKEFALKSKKILLYLSDFKFNYDDVNSGIDYASATLPAMQAYSQVYEYFDDQEQEKMKSFFYTAVNAVKKCNDYWALNNPAGVMYSNHEGWHNVCFAMVGFFYNDQSLIDRAIDGKRGFNKMLQYGFQDDGVWLEASLPYHFVQLSTMIMVADMSYNCGYKTNLYENKIDGRSLSQLYLNIIDLSFPNTMIPPVGDGYGKARFLKNYGVYEQLYTKTGEPGFVFLINQNDKRNNDSLLYGMGEIPQKTAAPEVYSRLWMQHGYAMLRMQEGKDYWKGEGNTLFASFSHNSCHAHADGLSIMLFGEERLWLRDAECKNSGANTFGSDVNQHLNWTTPSHNTVIIDNCNQIRHPEPLGLFEFTVLPDLKRVCIGDLNGHLYEGVKQLRTCIVTDEYVLDVFEVESDEAHDVAWVTHVDARSDDIFSSQWRDEQWTQQQQPDDVVKTFSNNTAIASWSFLGDRQISQTGHQFWETFVNGDKNFRIDVVCSEPAKYVKTLFPLDESAPQKQMPMRLIESNADNIVYAALYRISDENIDERVDIVVSEESNTHDWDVVLKFSDQSISHRVAAIENKKAN
ncbi:MAG: alginate lyase family protein [Sedimentisphaeraceae bacterium JB056]